MKILPSVQKFLALIAAFFLCTSIAYADLGLSSSDFGSQSVDGSQVDGVQVHSLDDETSDAGNQHDGATDDSGSSGDPGTNSPVCETHDGNGSSEGSSCNMCPEGTAVPDKDSTTQSCNSKPCKKTYSYVNLFTRQYQDDLVDMSVKVAGGHAKVYRLYVDGKWQFEHEFNRIQGSSGDNTLKKGNLTYHKEAGGLYRYRTFTLHALDTGFRWQNKKGQYVLYDGQGRMVETGDRRGVLTYYTYQGNQLFTIQDRSHATVFDFTYTDQGKIRQVADQNGRTLHYTWENDLLTRVTDVLGHATRYSYSQQGQLTAKVDEAGRMFFITYHPDGAVKSVLSRMEGGYYFSFKTHYAKVTTSMGRISEFWFLDNGETSKVKRDGVTISSEEYYPGGRTTVDELNNRVIKTYDSNNNLLSQEFADGTSISYTYDAKNNLLSRADELGVTTHYTYNDMGLPTVVRKAYQTIDEQRTELAYDQDGNLTQITRQNQGKSVTTTFAYDAVGNVIKETNPEGGETIHTYDYMGNVLKTVNPVGLVSTKTYDLHGNLIQESHPNGRTLQFTYDAANRPIQSADSASGTTNLEYDFQDNLVKITDALGGISRFNYDKDNRLTKKVDQEGRYLIYIYEKGRRQPSKIIDANNNTIAITYQGYDNCGSCSKTYNTQPVQITFPTFSRLFAYDLRGRLIKQTDKAENIRQSLSFEYDKAGRRISETNAAGYVTRYTYDNLGRITSTTDPAQGVTSYTYDQLNNLLALTDAKGQETRFTYNSLGNTIQETRPLGNTFTYQYDLSGRLILSTDAKGQQRTYSYDQAGQLASYSLKENENTDPEKTVTLAFSQQGRLTGYNDGITTGRYEYDLLGRQLNAQVNYGTFTAGHSYTYYRNGLQKTYTSPDGQTQEFQYNNLNRLTQVAIPGAGKITYDGFKWLLPQHKAFPGGEEFNSYDGLLRLNKRMSRAGDAKVLDLRYTYDVLNQIVAKQSAASKTSYNYDDLQRLTRVEENGQTTEQYEYDPVHNRIASLEHADFVYNQNNQLLQTGETSFTYDANGSTISETTPSSQTEYVYNLENRLAEINRDGMHAQYLYDPLGRRIGKKVNSEQTWYYYTNEGLAAEYDATGNQTVQYIFAPGSLWTTAPLAMKRGDKYYFYHNDHLGAPNALTDSTGAISWQAIYGAFGDVDISVEDVKNNLRFPGQYYDLESKIIYNCFRYYFPYSGRYTRPDPVGMRGGENLYSYVGSDPINKVDSFGLYVQWIIMTENFVMLHAVEITEAVEYLDGTFGGTAPTTPLAIFLEYGPIEEIDSCVEYLLLDATHDLINNGIPFIIDSIVGIGSSLKDEWIRQNMPPEPPKREFYWEQGPLR